MGNVWAKNKALIWVLLFVFLFTSVFNTGTAFAGTEKANTETSVTKDVKVTENTYNSNGAMATSYDPEAWEDVKVTSMTLQEQGETVSRDDMEIHVIFTMNCAVPVEFVYAYISGTDIYSYDVEPTGNENEYIVTFELDSELEGKCSIVYFHVNDEIPYSCFDIDNNDEWIYKYNFKVEYDYYDSLVLKSVEFADDFDGIVELTDDVVSETVSLDMEFEPYGSVESSILELYFVNQDTGDEIYEESYYYNDTEKCHVNIPVDIGDKISEGKYVLDRVVYDCSKYIRIDCDEEVSFVFKDNHTDIDAPVVNDIYFVLDGEKCEESGFTVTPEQELKVVLDVSDASEINIEESSVYFRTLKYNGIVDSIDLDEMTREGNLYTGVWEIGEDYTDEWYIWAIDLEDKYKNDIRYKSFNGESLASKYLYYNMESPAEASTYNFNLEFYDCYGDWIKDVRVNTERKTSFDKMGISVPNYKLVNAEFLGWKTANGDYIKTNDQLIYLEYEDINTFEAKYDKAVVKVWVDYKNYSTAIMYVGVDEGMTWGELKDKLLDSGALKAYEGSYEDRVFDEWDIYIDDENEVIDTSRYQSLSVEAWYRYTNFRTYSFNANGGTFSDGTSYKTMSLDEYDRDAIDQVEIPTREGYVFTGWTDDYGYVVDELEWAYSTDFDARWISESDASIDYGYLEFVIGEPWDEETGEIYYDDSEYISGDQENYEIELPFNVNPDYVRLRIEKYDGTTELIPVELQDGETIVAYDSVSYDGMNTITYTIKLTLGEPALYETSVIYETEDSMGHLWFDFENNMAEVMVPNDFNGSIYLSGYDMDGEWFTTDSIAMGGADEIELTYTSKVDGQVYTVKVIREVSDYIGFGVYLLLHDGEKVTNIGYYDNWDLCNWVDNIEVPYGSLSTNPENVYVSIELETWDSGMSCDLPLNENKSNYEDGSYETYEVDVKPVDGKVSKTFTVTAQSGRTETYTINVIERASGAASNPDGTEKPGACEKGHSYNFVVTLPTCSADGYTTYTCTVCGDSYVADNTKATGHQHKQALAAVAPTCTKDGLAAGEKCTDCGTVITAQQKVPAKGHSYTSKVTSPTCTAEGYMTYTCACGDSYVGDKVAAKGHTPGAAATCTAAQNCTVCGDIIAPTTGHAWNDKYTVDKAASTKAAGSKSKHCATCDAVDETSVVKIAKIKKTTAADQVYNGKNKTQNVTVVNFNGKKLVKGKDFTVTYKKAKGNKIVTPKAIGEYKAIVKFKGDYSGSVTKIFKINPQGTNLKKVTKGKKQFTATWNKKTVQVTGYQIRYSTKQNMNGAKTKLVNKAKTTKTTIKNLKAKKKYWVQIRTYKTVNGKKYYSAWSAKKQVTTK